MAHYYGLDAIGKAMDVNPRTVLRMYERDGPFMYKRWKRNGTQIWYTNDALILGWEQAFARVQWKKRRETKQRDAERKRSGPGAPGSVPVVEQRGDSHGDQLPGGELGQDREAPGAIGACGNAGGCCEQGCHEPDQSGGRTDPADGVDPGQPGPADGSGGAGGPAESAFERAVRAGVAVDRRGDGAA